MKIQVKLMDLTNNVKVFQGFAQKESLKNNGISICMETENMKYTWKCFEKGMMIESISEYKVNLSLKENSQTQGHIETEFGIIYLQCKTSVYKMNEKCIEVKYDLIQGEDKQPFHFVLEISKEETYAIH